MRKLSFSVFFLSLIVAGKLQAQNIGIGTTHPAQKLNGSLTSPWLLGGNTGVGSATNFLGTLDTAALRFRINNQWAGLLDSVSQSAYYGYGAGKNTTTGTLNTATGYQALNANTTGFANTAAGFQALFTNNGAFNSAFGAGALFSNSSGANNMAAGPGAMFLNQTGNNNTALGYQAMRGNISGFSNVAIGVNALFNNSVGTNLVAVGDSALFSQDGGSGGNTAIGSKALLRNSGGAGNTAIGYQALSKSLNDGNTGIGMRALGTNVTGFSNTAVGTEADVAFDGVSNATAIGFDAIVNASNKVRIGNSAVTVIEGQVLPTTPSDGRYKFNIREDIKGLDFILKLRPVSYQFDVRRFDGRLRTGAGHGNGNYEASYDEAMALRRTGFIAQEVEKAAGESGYDFTGVIKPKNDADHYGLSYEAFIMPMVKAMQEQQQQIDELKKIVAQQRKMIDEVMKNK